MSVLIELCTDSLGAAITAEKSGANRIELCAGLAEGGVTPSHGTIQSVVRALTIPVHVLVRPRPGNFHYTGDEIDSMLRDIAFCKKVGVAGVVTGALTASGQVDEDVSRRLREAAHSLNTTFHRAFDVADDPHQAMEKVIPLGYHRILTSGQMMSAFEGRFLLAELVKAAAGRIIIMPGAGINEENLRELYKCTRAREYHMSLRNPISKDHCLESLNTNSSLMSVSAERTAAVMKIAAELD